MFFTVAALLLVTAGVFAGKARFLSGAPTNLYFYDPGFSQYYAIGTTVAGSVLDYTSSLGTNTQTTISAQGYTANDKVFFYYASGATYYPVY